MKTIGVLGGLGPQATMDFEARVHRVAQRAIAPCGNQGYPPMVVYYCRFVPHAAPARGRPAAALRPHRDLLRAASQLGHLADFIVVTSNFVHVFRPEIEQAAGRRLLSMVDLTLAEVGRRAWRNVGVLGFGDPLVYTEPLVAMGRRCETIDGDLRSRLDTAIGHVMEGRADDADAGVAREALAALRARGLDGIIVGCTEIPLLLSSTASESDLLDPLQLLAEAAVEQALRTEGPGVTAARARPPERSDAARDRQVAPASCYPRPRR